MLPLLRCVHILSISEMHPGLVAKVTSLAGEAELKLEVQVEYVSAPQTSAEAPEAGPMRGRRLCLPVHLLLQPAVQVRAPLELHQRLRHELAQDNGNYRFSAQTEQTFQGLTGALLSISFAFPTQPHTHLYTTHYVAELDLHCDAHQVSDIGLVEQWLPASSVSLKRTGDGNGVLEHNSSGSDYRGAQHSAGIASQVYLETEVSNRMDSPVEVRCSTHSCWHKQL